MFRVKETTVLETDGSSKQNQVSMSLQCKYREAFFSFSSPCREILQGGGGGEKTGKADHIPMTLPSRFHLHSKH